MNDYYFKPKGLANYTCNCYMNSLLQCLYYCIDFRNKILEIDCTEDNSMVQSLKELFKELSISKKNYVYPLKIKEKLNENQLFKDGFGSDVVDLLDYIFNSITYELKQENSFTGTVNYENNIYDKNKMLREAKEDISTKTMLDDIFMGIYEKEYRGRKGHSKYSFQIEYRIVFSLEKVSKILNKNEFTLYDCFFYSYKCPEKTTEKCYCNHCNEFMSLYERIYENPKILIIILDRGYHKKYDKKVNFDLEIDISDYIDKDEKNNNSHIYKLIGVSTHIGSTGKFGHYISSCLSDNGCYYSFNDRSVIKEKDSSFTQKNSSYILFYKRVDNQGNSSKNMKNNRIKRYEINTKSKKEIIIEQIIKYLKYYPFQQNENEYLWSKEKDKTVKAIFINETIKFIFEQKSQSIYNLNSYNNRSSFTLKLNEISSDKFLNVFKEKFNEFFKSHK